MVPRVPAALCLALLCTASCQQRKQDSAYHVRLHVTNVPGDPLSGVAVSLGANRLGVTGEDGSVALDITGREGMRANLRVECPPNHRQPEAPVVVGLYDYASGGTPEISTVCEQERVRQGVIVRSVGARELPFSIRGQVAGTTDSAGFAHVLAEGEPGETLDLTFDTSEYPDLRPANPSVRLVLGNHDDAALAEQRFEVNRPKQKKGRGTGKGQKARPTHVVRHDGPVRIR